MSQLHTKPAAKAPTEATIVTANTKLVKDAAIDITYEYNEKIRVEFQAPSKGRFNQGRWTYDFLLHLFKAVDGKLAVVSKDGKDFIRKSTDFPNDAEGYEHFFPNGTSRYTNAKSRCTVIILLQTCTYLADIKRLEKGAAFLKWMRENKIYAFKHKYETTIMGNIGYMYGCHPKHTNKDDLAQYLIATIEEHLKANKEEATIPLFEIVTRVHTENLVIDDNETILHVPLLEIRCEKVHMETLDRLLLESQTTNTGSYYVPFAFRFMDKEKYLRKLQEHAAVVDNLKHIQIKGINQEVWDSTNSKNQTLMHHFLTLTDEESPDYWIQSIEKGVDYDTTGRWKLIIASQYYHKVQAFLDKDLHSLVTNCQLYNCSLFDCEPQVVGNYQVHQKYASMVLESDPSVSLPSEPKRLRSNDVIWRTKHTIEVPPHIEIDSAPNKRKQPVPNVWQSSNNSISSATLSTQFEKMALRLKQETDDKLLNIDTRFDKLEATHTEQMQQALGATEALEGYCKTNFTDINNKLAKLLAHVCGEHHTNLPTSNHLDVPMLDSSSNSPSTSSPSTSSPTSQYNMSMTPVNTSTNWSDDEITFSPSAEDDAFQSPRQEIRKQQRQRNFIRPKGAGSPKTGIAK